MKCKELKEEFVGIFDFEKEKKGKGKGTINEKGKEYFVEYDENGEELKILRKRTFEGIRLMIIGNRLYFIYFLFLFFLFIIFFYFSFSFISVFHSVLQFVLILLFPYFSLTFSLITK
jgi:hypothetical protein